MPRPKAPPLGIVLTLLRSAIGWTHRELADATGTRSNMLSEYERGPRHLTRETLEQLIVPMGYDPEAIDLALLGLAGIAVTPLGRPLSPVDASPAECRRVKRVAARFGLIAADLTESYALELVRTRRAEAARMDADRLSRLLAACSAGEQKLLVERSRDFQTWALSAHLCMESERAAADDPPRAAHLAGLALRIAELAPGEPAWRSRLQGYSWAFIGNGRRVAGDLRGAEAAFATAWKLWHAGGGAGPVLAEWRLLDLEASLRRDLRHFPDALELLDRARAAAPRTELGRILLKRATIQEQAGEVEAANSTLGEAAPLVEEGNNPRLRWALDFTMIVNLCHLGRYGDADARLPALRELTVELANQLDLLRVLWLAGRVAAGLGLTDQARATFAQVREDFAARRMAYDTALVTLELAVLDLDAGRTGEVRLLAREMAWIFRTQHVHREALAALRLFCQAAAAETVTASMARRFLAYLERARSDPQLRLSDLA
jgi:transcriptional regulator with XRE-family HTH domain